MLINTKLLKSKMALKDFNIKTLSAEIGVNRDTLSNVIHGKNRPSYSVINGIYFALELTPQEGRDIFFSQDLRKTKV
ncbi:MAG: helix-turn-helix transcriptional regulator [Staphylococcus lugdunensis]|uniref:helix-turn-helix domain-containing protein n=1 Tax=Staphylococcus lugdunensis TaxID=28035 RepID=UPI00076B66FB|nr:helix-turn-helix transcriptional regulator [Staphylococcus lugdunensis]AMG63432.1 transcriptional regulator [Staphylococcus lugdunensis]MCI2815870.1 helix-turn-helix transcriptional regulator [Staphylococcus lugdunensis]MDU0967444.1 helix-turn-helix transcriptional regulator [Staphylococcus lugdunensis]MDU1965362.1 helix-turn-helix transcriptional regulator [Staphylococcus lugdunensis]MDU2323065.1 helix-turn-helix transcriptional regulator [Staphylococcus lugdunensis]